MQLSIIIPTLNEERYLPKLLASLASTSLVGLEVIVVDGQSTDQTLATIQSATKAYQDNFPIRCILSHERGVSHQRNLGAQYARHDLLLFLDADVIAPTAAVLQKWYDAFQSEGLVAATCRFRPLNKHPLAHFFMWFTYNFHRYQAVRKPWGIGACIMIRRDIFQRLGGFDETIKVNEDANLLERSAALGPFRLFPESVGLSMRRFERTGYIRMVSRYVYMGIYRKLVGEMRANHVKYPFGHYDE